MSAYLHTHAGLSDQTGFSYMIYVVMGKASLYVVHNSEQKGI